MAMKGFLNRSREIFGNFSIFGFMNKSKEFLGKSSIRDPWASTLFQDPHQWIQSFFHAMHSPYIDALRKGISKFPPLLAFPVEVFLPFFFILNLYKSAIVAWYMDKSVNSVLVPAAIISYVLGLEEGNFETLSICFLFSISLLMLGDLDVEHLVGRAFKFIALNILITFSHPMSIVISVCFYTCLYKQYTILSNAPRSQIVTLGIVYFAAGFTICLYLFKYLNNWTYSDLLVFECIAASGFAYHIVLSRDSTVWLRIHILISVFVQFTMIVYFFDVLKHKYTFVMPLK